MTQLPQNLDAVYWAARADADTAQLAQLTGRPAPEIDRDLHQPDQHQDMQAHVCGAGCTPKPSDSPGSVTFSPTPYGWIHIKVIDRGYPREGIIETHQLIRHVTRALELGFVVIDHMDPGRS